MYRVMISETENTPECYQYFLCNNHEFKGLIHTLKNLEQRMFENILAREEIVHYPLAIIFQLIFPILIHSFIVIFNAVV